MSLWEIGIIVLLVVLLVVTIYYSNDQESFTPVVPSTDRIVAFNMKGEPIGYTWGEGDIYGDISEIYAVIKNPYQLWVVNVNYNPVQSTMASNELTPYYLTYPSGETGLIPHDQYRPMSANSGKYRLLVKLNPGLHRITMMDKIGHIRVSKNGDDKGY